MTKSKIISLLSAATLVTAVAATSACKKQEDDSKKGAKPAVSAGKTTAATDTPKPLPPKKEWTAADTLKVFKTCGDAFNAHDKAKTATCFGKSGTFQMIDWVGPEMKHSGGEAVAKSMADYWTSMPDVKGTTMLTMVSGNNIAAISLDEGTNSGEMMGMPATNKKVSLFSAMLTSVGKDGTIASQRILGDQGTWSHQLGMAPIPTAPASEKAWETTVTAIANDADKAKIAANVEAVKKFEAATSKSDMATIKAHVADDISFRYAPHAKVTKGAKDYFAALAQWTGMFESMNRENRTIWGAGDWVVSEVNNNAKIGVEMSKDKKNSTKGKEITTTQIEFYLVVDSKITNHWVFENSYSFAVQAGLAPAPPAMGSGDAAKPAAGKDAKEVIAPAKGKPAPSKK